SSLAFAMTAGVSAETYPTRSITMIVPFPPGGATDVQARALAKMASEKLGQPIVIMNKPGAAGTVGPAWMAANAKPDGYTLSVTGAALFMQPHISQVTFDPIKDFTYISFVAFYGNGLMVNASSRWTSLQALVEEAKAKPGAISWGAAGAAGGGRIIMESLQDTAGVKFNFIP